MFIIAGILIGIILGLTGAGGGILSAPVLHFIGLPLSQATPIGLIAIAFSSSIGAINGLHAKIVRYKAGMLMALMALPFSYMGVMLAKKLPHEILLILFSLVMFLVAIRLLSKKNLKPTVIAKINPQNGKFVWNTSTACLVSGVGAIAGFFSGLLGVGGGFIIVPLLKKFTDLSIKGIIATSLMVISLISLVSVYFAVSHGIHIPINITIFFSIATLLGMLVGRKISVFVSEKYIQYGFAMVLILIASVLILQNI